MHRVNYTESVSLDLVKYITSKFKTDRFSYKLGYQIPPSKVKMFQGLSLRIATFSFVSLPFSNFTLHGMKTPA